jgi:hypothetical protein
MAKVNQYGLLEDENAPGGGANPASGIANTGGSVGGNTTPYNVNPYAGTQTPTFSKYQGNAVIPEAQQFAFNSNYAAQSQALDRALANKDLERSNAISSIGQAHERSRADADTARAKALDQLIGRNASTGALWSTVDQGQRTDLQTNFQKFLGDLDINRANAEQDIHRGYGQFISDINQQKAGMWGQQQREEEAARIKAADDARAAQQAEAQAQAQREQAQAYRDAQAAAAARPVQQPSYTPAHSNGGGGGGGGGGGAGWSSAQASQAGIGPNDTLQDIQNQLPLLGMHQLSVLYGAPELNNPAFGTLKQAIGKYIYEASSPGKPGYRPSDYSEPGGFW